MCIDTIVESMIVCCIFVTRQRWVFAFTLQSLPALRKNPPLPIELEAGSVSLSLWVLGIREKSLASCEIK
jgi:hypothetical protein